MSMTASKLRQDIYRALDEVLETGVPLEIERKGRLLRIVPVAAAEKPQKKLENLQRHDDYLLCDPEELVHLDWSKEWRP